MQQTTHKQNLNSFLAPALSEHTYTIFLISLSAKIERVKGRLTLYLSSIRHVLPAAEAATRRNQIKC